METRRPVTEEDIRRTEALIAESYRRLKQSMGKAPSRAPGSVVGTIKKHPLGTAAAAVVVGIALYGVFRALTKRMTAKEVSGGGRERGSFQDMPSEVIRILVPLAIPYIAGYLEKYMARMLPGGRR